MVNKNSNVCFKSYTYSNKNKLSSTYRIIPILVLKKEKEKTTRKERKDWAGKEVWIIYFSSVVFQDFPRKTLITIGTYLQARKKDRNEWNMCNRS
jgi:hypothetical protein